MNFFSPLLGEGKALTASLPYFLVDYIPQSWDRTTIAMFTRRFLVCRHAGEKRPNRPGNCVGKYRLCLVWRMVCQCKDSHVESTVGMNLPHSHYGYCTRPRGLDESRSCGLTADKLSSVRRTRRPSPVLPGCYVRKLRWT